MAVAKPIFRRTLTASGTSEAVVSHPRQGPPHLCQYTCDDVMSHRLSSFYLSDPSLSTVLTQCSPSGLGPPLQSFLFL